MGLDCKRERGCQFPAKWCLASCSFTATADSSVRACNCIGPQNGQPLCPCQMRHVQIIDGRYVRITDLGPVREKISPALGEFMDALGIPEKRQKEIQASSAAAAEEIVADLKKDGTL